MNEVLVFCMGKNSKPVDKIILPDVVVNIKTMPQPTRGNDNQKFSIKYVRFRLESDQVCAKATPSIITMAVLVIVFVGDSVLQDQIFLRKCTLTCLLNNVFSKGH